MPAMTTLVTTAVLGCAAILPGCGAAIDSALEPDPTIPVCEADADGIVWQFYTDDDFGCDVTAGQTLALTGTPGQDECDDMGGTYTAYTDLDPNDDWDDSAYGDCMDVDF
jgi:hypothetical protein